MQNLLDEENIHNKEDMYKVWSNLNNKQYQIQIFKVPMVVEYLKFEVNLPDKKNKTGSNFNFPSLDGGLL